MWYCSFTVCHKVLSKWCNKSRFLTSSKPSPKYHSINYPFVHESVGKKIANISCHVVSPYSTQARFLIALNSDVTESRVWKNYSNIIKLGIWTRCSFVWNDKTSRAGKTSITIVRFLVVHILVNVRNSDMTQMPSLIVLTKKIPGFLWYIMLVYFITWISIYISKPNLCPHLKSWFLKFVPLNKLHIVNGSICLLPCFFMNYIG